MPDNNSSDLGPTLLNIQHALTNINQSITHGLTAVAKSFGNVSSDLTKSIEATAERMEKASRATRMYSQSTSLATNANKALNEQMSKFTKSMGGLGGIIKDLVRFTSYNYLQKLVSGQTKGGMSQMIKWIKEEHTGGRNGGETIQMALWKKIGKPFSKGSSESVHNIVDLWIKLPMEMSEIAKKFKKQNVSKAISNSFNQIGDYLSDFARQMGLKKIVATSKNNQMAEMLFHQLGSYVKTDGVRLQKLLKSVYSTLGLGINVLVVASQRGFTKLLLNMSTGMKLGVAMARKPGGAGALLGRFGKHTPGMGGVGGFIGRGIGGAQAGGPMGAISGAFGVGTAGALGIAAALTAALALMYKLISLFNKFDSMATKFRMNMGFVGKYAVGITQQSALISKEWAKFGADLDDSLNAFTAIADAIGSTTAAASVVGAMVLFNKQLDISYGLSSEFLMNMSMLGKTTMKNSTELLYTVGRLSQEKMVNLSGAMTDINDSMKSSYSLFRKSPAELVKASVEAKRMGTNLQSTAQAAQGLLDFTSSVNAEMEASVLLGQPLNLQRMRQLAYTGDMVGLQEEMLSQLGKLNFESLDYFQKESVAKAFGKQASELGRMLAVRRNELSLNKSVVQIQKEAYANQVKTIANQTALNQVSNAFGQIWIELAPTMLTIAESIRSMIPTINWLVQGAIKLVQAIDSIQTILLDTINLPTAPFKMLFGGSGYIDKMSKDIMNVIPKSMKPTTNVGENTMVDQRNKEIIDIVPEKVKPPMDYSFEVNRTATNNQQAYYTNDRLDKLININEKVLASNEILRKGFENGTLKASVNLDGQRLDASLDRTVNFIGKHG